MLNEARRRATLREPSRKHGNGPREKTGGTRDAAGPELSGGQDKLRTAKCHLDHEAGRGYGGFEGALT